MVSEAYRIIDPDNACNHHSINQFNSVIPMSFSAITGKLFASPNFSIRNRYGLSISLQWFERELEVEWLR